MAVLLRTDDSWEPIVPDNGKRFSGEEARKLVGGYIQVVRIDNGSVMLVDEDGLPKKRPLNRQATNVARMAKAISPTDIIVGDAVLCERHQF